MYVQSRLLYEVELCTSVDRMRTCVSVCLPEPSSCSLSDIHIALNNVIAINDPVYPRNTSIVGLSGWVGCHGYNGCVIITKCSMYHLANYYSRVMVHLCVYVQYTKEVLRN